MKDHIAKVPLLDRRRGEFIDADLFLGVDGATLDSFENHWRPIFEGLADDKKPEDAHWEWTPKVLHAQQNPLNYELFSIESEGRTQGLMMAVKGGLKTFSRHPDHVRAPIVYVDFLATAPWNRPDIADAPQYKGVGRTLFTTAVSLSRDEGFEGRVGLHSLLEAELFYRDVIGMTDMDIDQSYEKLRYFELSTNQASQFLTA